MGNLPSRPEPIVPAALDAAMVPSLEHLGEIPEGAVVNCAGDDDAAVPKKRRKKEFVSDFLKTWFVQKKKQLQAQRCGWSHLRSWQEAVRLAPEAFLEVHPDTPRRWHKQAAKTQPLTRGPKPFFYGSTAHDPLAELYASTLVGIKIVLL